MKAKEEAQVISDTSGTLTGILIDELANALIKLSLSQKDALKHQDIISKGAVLIVISTQNKEEEQAAKGIMKDQNGKLIKKL